MVNSVDASLDDWADLKDDRRWQGLLIGNGGSRAVWESFKYDSLYDMACSDETAEPLTATDQRFFDEMGTRNFEQVLAGLATSRIVCEALGMDTTKIDERYRSIQKALFGAVSAVHVPWDAADGNVYQAINAAMRPHDFVYSTNYDLVVYWSLMADSDGFKDYFWSGTFDQADTEVYGNPTMVLYLHGGIHLALLASGATEKRTGVGGNLIDSLATMPTDQVPLFITEGTSRQKLDSIYRSDYLRFAYQRFARHEGAMVVFGHSLSDADQHLVDAMKSWGARDIAVAVYPGTPAEVIGLKADLHQRLPAANLAFFDSRTHPLGAASVRIG